MFPVKSNREANGKKQPAWSVCRQLPPLPGRFVCCEERETQNAPFVCSGLYSSGSSCAKSEGAAANLSGDGEAEAQTWGVLGKQRHKPEQTGEAEARRCGRARSRSGGSGKEAELQRLDPPHCSDCASRCWPTDMEHNWSWHLRRGNILATFGYRRVFCTVLSCKLA